MEIPNQIKSNQIKHFCTKNWILYAPPILIHVERSWHNNSLCHDLSDTISKKYVYVDDLAILTAQREWKKIESTPSQDMGTLALYPRQWRLKLSEYRTVSTVFHLNKKEAKCELDVYIDTRRLNFQPTTTYIGFKLDRTLSYRQHLAGLRDEVMARSALVNTPHLCLSTCVCTS